MRDWLLLMARAEHDRWVATGSRDALRMETRYLDEARRLSALDRELDLELGVVVSSSKQGGDHGDQVPVRVRHLEGEDTDEGGVRGSR